MKRLLVLLLTLMLLLSGCVATTERLEARPARAEKLMGQER